MTQRFRLYCGLSSSAGEIAPEQVQSFLADTVAPTFPAFTVFPAHGYWEAKPERTLIIETIADYDARPALERIAELYAARFNQDSVLLTQETIASTLLHAAQVAA